MFYFYGDRMAHLGWLLVSMAILCWFWGCYFPISGLALMALMAWTWADGRPTPLEKLITKNQQETKR